MPTTDLENQLSAAFQVANERQGAGLDDFFALYHEDVYFEDPVQRVHGKEAFREAMLRMYRKLKQVEFQLQTFSMDAQGEEAHATWVMHFRPRIAPSSITRRLGPVVAIEGASHFRLREGRILYHRDYWDLLSSLIETSPVAALAYRSLTRRIA